MKRLREQVIDYMHANDVNDALARRSEETTRRTELTGLATWPVKP